MLCKSRESSSVPCKCERESNSEAVFGPYRGCLCIDYDGDARLSNSA